MELIDEHKAFAGWQRRYTHASKRCGCDMTFALYLPPQAESRAVPVVYWLSGLTCTDENFVNKAGAQRVAADLGLALVAPDTSPRGADVADEDRFDMGQGAGFYVDATRPPWAQHYQMYSYVTEELPALLGERFDSEIDLGREAIAGHSMGGHGALVVGLNEPARYAAIAGFSPVCAPTEVPWGQNAFSKYLGEDRAAWVAYDACALIEAARQPEALPPIRIDQGLADNFLDEQLRPDRIEEVAAARGVDAAVYRREGYDHSYFFIASFIEQHLRFLKEHLERQQ